MKRNERLKSYTIFNKICLLTIVLFFIETLVGCSKNLTVETGEVTAKVAGRILDSSGSKGISVKLVRLDISGEAKTVSLEDVFTNAEGKFVLETNLDGESNLLVQADKDAKEWREILTASVKPGIAVYAQPLNKVTTISADLYVSAIESQRDIDYTQIRLLIDKEIAMILDTSRELFNNFVNAVATEFSAEKLTLLRSEIGGTTSQWQQIIVARIAAQTALDRDLYFALSESAEQTAFYNYLYSVSDAYVDVGLQSDTFSKVLEASIRTFLKEIEGINSRLEFELLRRTSEIRARILNVSVLSEFQELGADPSMINKIIYAGETLQDGLQNTQSAEDVANEFDSYHNKVLENLVKVLGIYGDTIQTFQGSIAGYKTALITEVRTSSDTDGIISAYLSFYTKVKDLVIQQLNLGTAEKNAAAEVMILLNMYF
jgi:hypothetical protein